MTHKTIQPDATYSDVFDHPRPWYAVKSILYIADDDLYEERTILFQATNIDHALSRGAGEAKQYASSLENCVYIGYSEAFNLFDEILKDGTEVFSLMRTSNLNNQEYIEQYVATQQEVGIKRTVV